MKKFYTEEISILKNGTSAHALTEKNNAVEAEASAYAALSYAMLNADVKSIHVEAKDSEGSIYCTHTFVAADEE